MKIAVYAIAKNEEKHVSRFMAGCAGADLVVVADTGSTDNTIAALRDEGAVVHHIAIQPWRFDDARNAALALVAVDVDVCICLDLDEVLSPGWRDALERQWEPGTTMGRCRYITSHRADGEPAVEINGAKIHSRFGYRWAHMIHEILVPNRLENPREIQLRDLRMDHWPDPAKKTTMFYRALLEAAVKESPDDARDVWMLARHYTAYKRFADAEPLWRHYLLLAGERWPQQRASAWRRLGRCHDGMGKPEAALTCYREGLRIAPAMRDLWLDLAGSFSAQSQWAEALDAYRKAFALPLTTGGVSNEMENSGGSPFYNASLAALQLGLLPEARAFAHEACQREPHNQKYAAHRAQQENS